MLTGDPSIDSYRGGKHLDAIALNDRIKGVQKAVLHAITSQMHIKGDFSEERWIYLSTLVRRSGFSQATVGRAVRDLIENGYLLKRPQKKKGDRLAVLYRLTDKLFAEFEHDTNVKILQRFSPDNVYPLRCSE